MTVDVGEEPWEPYDKGLKIRYQGRLWHCFGMRHRNPPGGFVVELTETKAEEGDKVVDWAPKSAR